MPEKTKTYNDKVNGFGLSLQATAPAKPCAILWANTIKGQMYGKKSIYPKLIR
jgi:hypothetical protein